MLPDMSDDEVRKKEVCAAIVTVSFLESVLNILLELLLQYEVLERRVNTRNIVFDNV